MKFQMKNLLKPTVMQNRLKLTAMRKNLQTIQTKSLHLKLIRSNARISLKDSTKI